MSKKQIIISSSGAVILLLLVFAGFKLYSGVSSFSQAEKDLQTSMTRLSRFYASKPFPSQENIDIEDSNIKTLSDWYAILVDGIRKGQIPDSDERRPSKFIDTLTAKRNEIKTLAREAKPEVTFPEDFALGFQKYSEGDLPDPKYVPRLTQQLAIMDSICRLMIQNGVSQVISVHREIIESDTSSKLSTKKTYTRHTTSSTKATESKWGRSPLMDQARTTVNSDAGLFVGNSIYTKFHFSFLIKAYEPAFVSLLNMFAESPLFIVTTKVTLQKDDNDVVLPKKDTDLDKSAVGSNRMRTKGRESTARRTDVDLLKSFLQGQQSDDDLDDNLNNKSVVSTNGVESLPASSGPVRLSRKQRMVSGSDFEKPIDFLIEVDVYRFDEIKGE